MLFYFFIFVGVGSLTGLVVILGRQLSFVRVNKLTDLAQNEEDLEELFGRRIDSFYDYFALFFKRLAHAASLLILRVLHKMAMISRFLLTRIERKFSRLIDAVHGRTALLNRGAAASPFLAQIRDHKEAALANWKTANKQN